MDFYGQGAYHSLYSAHSHFQQQARQQPYFPQQPIKPGVLHTNPVLEKQKQLQERQAQAVPQSSYTDRQLKQQAPQTYWQQTPYQPVTSFSALELLDGQLFGPDSPFLSLGDEMENTMAAASGGAAGQATGSAASSSGTGIIADPYGSIDPALLKQSIVQTKQQVLSGYMSTTGPSTATATPNAQATEVIRVPPVPKGGNPTQETVAGADIDPLSSFDCTAMEALLMDGEQIDAMLGIPYGTASASSSTLAPAVTATASSAPLDVSQSSRLNTWEAVSVQPTIPLPTPSTAQYSQTPVSLVPASLQSPYRQQYPPAYYSQQPSYPSSNNYSTVLPQQPQQQQQLPSGSYNAYQSDYQGYYPSSQQQQQQQQQSSHERYESPGMGSEHGYNLNFIRECLDLVDLYREYVGTVAPLHPSILDENNVRYVVATSTGAAERSALTCGVYLAMAYGAWHAGNEKLSTECHSRGHAIQAQLIADNIGLTDYSMAMNLAGYGRYALFFQMDDAKGWNFYQLAMNVCRNISALNSDIYCRSLYIMNCHERATFEDLEMFQKETSRVRNLPYYLFPSIPVTCKQGYPWMRSTRAATLQKDIYWVAANLLGAYRLCRMATPMARHTSEFSPQDGMLGVLRLLEKCKTDITQAFDDAKRQNDPLPPITIVSFIVFYLAMKADIYHQIQMDAPALQWAMEFVHYLKEQATYSGYYLTINPIFIDSVLQIFWDLRKLDLLKSFLDFLSTFTGVPPLLSKSIVRFYQLYRNVSESCVRSGMPADETQLLSGSVGVVGVSHTQPHQHHHHAHHHTQPHPQLQNFGGCEVIAKKPGVIPLTTPNVKVDDASKRKRSASSGPSRAATARGGAPPAKRGRLHSSETSHSRQQHAGASAHDEDTEKGVVFIGDGVKRARKRRRRQKEISEIWGANASRHSVLSECRTYMSLYRKHLWHFAPLHPAVLDESNIQYFVLGDGSREISTLSLSMLLGLSRGAVAAGNMKAASEFFKRGEQQMESLLQSPESKSDYALALAAAHMVWMPVILQDSKAVAKCRFYGQTSLSICEALGSYNTDAYSRALIGLALVAEWPLSLTAVPLAPIDSDGSALREPSIVFGKYRRMSECPYVPITQVTPHVFTVGTNIAEDEDDHCRTFAGLQLQMPVSTRNLATLAIVFGMWADTLGSLKVARQKNDPVGIARTTDNIAELRRVMKEFKDEQRQASDEWPDSAYRLMRLIAIVTDSVTYVLRGMPVQAHECAVKFLDMAEKPAYEALEVGVHLLFQSMAEVMWELRSAALLSRVVQLIGRRPATPLFLNLKALCLQQLPTCPDYTQQQQQQQHRHDWRSSGDGLQSARCRAAVRRSHSAHRLPRVGHRTTERRDRRLSTAHS
eukprot:TRINITY_DN4442_c0_g1_i4.p1 TRINITY_DN4442_c0_g1~~TRINITY_DN4442_c0_g1_i4.p1  ORF type:complete len:1372 (-),score=229.09 TRINITY_DN4442_c0_g1_i4:2815-6930(-)